MTTARPWSLLRRHDYRWLVVGGTISRLGSAIAPVALAFAVLDLTGSATALGVVVGARSITNVALLLLGGVVADRLPRRTVMVVSSVASGVTQAAVAGLVATRHDSVALLALLSALNGAVSAFALPAAAARMPDTVPASDLVPANALNRLGANAANVIGTSVAGLVVVSLGSAWGIGVDAVTFLLAAAAFARVRGTSPDLPRATAVPATVATTGPTGPAGPAGSAGPAGPAGPVAPPRPSVLHDLRTGWSSFRSRQWLWVVVVCFTVINAAYTGAVVVLGPVVADQSFGRGVWGVVLAGQTVGFVLGGLLALRLRVRRLLRFGMACMVLFGVPLFTLAAGVPAVVAFSAFLLAGVGVEQFGVAWETTMQTHIPAALLARVYSYDMVGSFVAIPAGEIVAGPAASAFGLTTTLVAAGILVVAASLTALVSPQVRTLPRVAHAVA